MLVPLVGHASATHDAGRRFTAGHGMTQTCVVGETHESHNACCWLPCCTIPPIVAPLCSGDHEAAHRGAAPEHRHQQRGADRPLGAQGVVGAGSFAACRVHLALANKPAWSRPPTGVCLTGYVQYLFSFCFVWPSGGGAGSHWDTCVLRLFPLSRPCLHVHMAFFRIYGLPCRRRGWTPLTRRASHTLLLAYSPACACCCSLLFPAGGGSGPH